MKSKYIAYSCCALLLFTMAFSPIVSVKGWTLDNQSIVAELNKAYVDVVKKVKPTVVDISWETTITRQTQPFGFDDPFFRQFFGDSPMFQMPPQRQKLQTRGSGVIVRKDGYILTNNHVVRNNGRELGKITVTLSDGRTKDAKIIGTDDNTDLAVIRIDGDNYPVAELGDSDAVEVGQIVFTFGSPFSFSGSVSQGIVSGLGRELHLSSIEDLIQTDAAMNPGNSGGPLVNISGEVIGINKAIATQGVQQSAGIGFSIPINLARSIMGDLINTGKWTRGYLGIQMNSISEDQAKQYNLPNTKGVLVANVVEKSPADLAGILVYDVIVTFNGKPVASIDELRRMVALTRIGDKVPVKVIREGKEKVLTVTIGTWPEESAVVTGNTFQKWGLTVQTLTEELAKQKGIEFGDGGLLIVDIDQNSKLYDLGVQKNDIFLEVDRKPVKDIKEFAKIVNAKKPGETVQFRTKSNRGTYNIILLTVPEGK